jgi:hypothetical protein
VSDNTKRVAEYRRRAAEARRMAAAASTPAEKADLLQVEKRWLGLAGNDEAESGHTREKKKPHRGAQRPKSSRGAE